MDSQPLEGNMIEEPVYQMCDISLDTGISKCKIQDFSFQVASGSFKSQISKVKDFLENVLGPRICNFKEMRANLYLSRYNFPKKEIVHKDGVTHPGSHG